MAKIQRIQSLKLESGGGEDGDKPIDLKLKKWSMAKLLFISRRFKNLLSEAFESVDLENMGDLKVFTQALNVLLSEDMDVTLLITESLYKSKLTSDEILEWTPEDFLVVIAKIVEMNVTEELVKNFQALLENAAVKAVNENRSAKEKKTSQDKTGSSGSETE